MNNEICQSKKFAIIAGNLIYNLSEKLFSFHENQLIQFIHWKSMEKYEGKSIWKKKNCQNNRKYE